MVVRGRRWHETVKFQRHPDANVDRNVHFRVQVILFSLLLYVQTYFVRSNKTSARRLARDSVVLTSHQNDGIIIIVRVFFPLLVYPSNIIIRSCDIMCSACQQPRSLFVHRLDTALATIQIRRVIHEYTTVRIRDVIKSPANAVVMYCKIIDRVYSFFFFFYRKSRFFNWFKVVFLENLKSLWDISNTWLKIQINTRGYTAVYIRIVIF